MSLGKEYIAKEIQSEAFRLGFDQVGFSQAKELIDDRERLSKWLENGYNAGMGYMANHFDKRVNPALLVEGSHSVISVVYNYNPPQPTLSQSAPKISRYAYGRDYHDIIKSKLSSLFNFVRDNLYSQLEGRFFIDSAPLLERSLAVRAGLGWIGKNSMLINRKLGSYLFIGELVVNIELPYNQSPMIDRCGGCSKCIDACPTQAILPDRVIDGNKCISYLTIENKGDIPESYKGKLEGWVFGCDICQEVCPWNRKAVAANEPEFRPSKALLSMTNKEWESLSAEEFSALFKGSPIKRAKYAGWMRNYQFITK